VNGTDWLRSLIGRKPKHASGRDETRPAASPDTVAAMFAHANDRPQHMATEYKASARPEPTDDEIEQLHAQLEAVLTPLLGPPSREQTQRLADAKAAQVREEKAQIICPCMVIYSRCYPQLHGTHLQPQP
jgi:hypothetical protein